MENYEKYYRRTYNAIDNILLAFKVSNSNLFIDNMTKRYTKFNLDKVCHEERISIINTIMIALLGLNKESIEDSGKVSNYNKNLENNILEKLPSEMQEIINKFDNNRVVNTDFDNWLSIITNIPSDKNNIDHLRRVRNALLHSNFSVDYENPLLDIIHLKIKSYYAADLLGLEFYRFIISYFGVTETSRVSPKILSFAFTKKNKQINDKQTLKKTLEEMKVMIINYDKVQSWKLQTPETILLENMDENGRVNFEKYMSGIFVDPNFANMYINKIEITKANVESVIDVIENKYGTEFYKKNVSTQRQIIVSFLELIYDCKKSITEWLYYFILIFMGINNCGNIKEQVIKKHIFEKDACYLSILILKCYLIIYRLQNENFIDIDYDKIDINYSKTDICFVSKKIQPNTKIGNAFLDNIFENQHILTDDEFFDKINDKNEKNRIVCNIIRNSLAHGNISFSIKKDMIIEFNDIDSKRNSIKTIQISTSTLEKILNSEALNPSNCVVKETGKTLRKIL